MKMSQDESRPTHANDPKQAESQSGAEHLLRIPRTPHQAFETSAIEWLEIFAMMRMKSPDAYRFKNHYFKAPASGRNVFSAALSAHGADRATLTIERDNHNQTSFWIAELAEGLISKVECHDWQGMLSLFEFASSQACHEMSAAAKALYLFSGDRQDIRIKEIEIGGEGHEFAWLSFSRNPAGQIDGFQVDFEADGDNYRLFMPYDSEGNDDRPAGSYGAPTRDILFYRADEVASGRNLMGSGKAQAVQCLFDVLPATAMARSLLRTRLPENGQTWVLPRQAEIWGNGAVHLDGSYVTPSVFKQGSEIGKSMCHHAMSAMLAGCPDLWNTPRLIKNLSQRLFTTQKNQELTFLCAYTLAVAERAVWSKASPQQLRAIGDVIYDLTLKHGFGTQDAESIVAANFFEECFSKTPLAAQIWFAQDPRVLKMTLEKMWKDQSGVPDEKLAKCLQDLALWQNIRKLPSVWVHENLFQPILDCGCPQNRIQALFERASQEFQARQPFTPKLFQSLKNEFDLFCRNKLTQQVLRESGLGKTKPASQSKEKVAVARAKQGPRI